MAVFRGRADAAPSCSSTSWPSAGCARLPASIDRRDGTPSIARTLSRTARRSWAPSSARRLTTGVAVISRAGRLTIHCARLTYLLVDRFRKWWDSSTITNPWVPAGQAPAAGLLVRAEDYRNLQSRRGRSPLGQERCRNQAGGGIPAIERRRHRQRDVSLAAPNRVRQQGAPVLGARRPAPGGSSLAGSPIATAAREPCPQLVSGCRRLTRRPMRAAHPGPPAVLSREALGLV